MLQANKKNAHLRNRDKSADENSKEELADAKGGGGGEAEGGRGGGGGGRGGGARASKGDSLDDMASRARRDAAGGFTRTKLLALLVQMTWLLVHTYFTCLKTYLLENDVLASANVLAKVYLLDGTKVRILTQLKMQRFQPALTTTLWLLLTIRKKTGNECW